jgi:hypothetical protein
MKSNKKNNKLNHFFIFNKNDTYYFYKLFIKQSINYTMSREEKENDRTWSYFDSECYNVLDTTDTTDDIRGTLVPGVEYTTQNQNYKNKLQFIIEKPRCYGVYTGEYSIFDYDDKENYYEVEFDIVQNLSFLEWSSHEIEKFVSGYGFRFGDTLKIHIFLETHYQRQILRKKMSITFSKSLVLQELPKDCLFQILTFI